MGWFQIIDAKSGVVKFDTRQSALVRDPDTNETETIFFGDKLDLESPVTAADARWDRWVKEIEEAQDELRKMLHRMEDQVVEGKKRFGNE